MNLARHWSIWAPILMKWLKDETLASISSIKPHDDPHIHCRPHLHAMPWLAQCNWLGLTSGQNPNLKEYDPTLDDGKPWWWWCITSNKMKTNLLWELWNPNLNHPQTVSDPVQKTLACTWPLHLLIKTCEDDLHNVTTWYAICNA